ncbi:MAG TPA: efflux RND transporter periplasmic adaptor subunit [Tepidisphaeraceae bacterium]
MKSGDKRVQKWVILLLASVAVAFLAWWGLSWFITPRVNVTRIVQGPVVQAFYATGTVQPVREFPIKANNEGILEKVLVDKGARVTAGQPLAILNDPVLRYRADRARATLDEKKKRADANNSPIWAEFDARISAADEMVATAGREVGRMEKMSLTNAASVSDRDRAQDVLQTRTAERDSLKAQRRAKLLELEREVQVAQAEYDSAVWETQQQTLKAPIDGVVLNRPTSQGTRVAINDVVMRVADVRPENLVMRAAVDEEDITKCRVGQIVRMSLYAFPGERVSGKVTQIYDEADPTRRTFEVDVTVNEAADRLSAGMTGELAFIIAEKASASILPSTAVQGGGVYVVVAGRIEKRTPEIGLRSFQRVEVISGITKDDTVIFSPIGTLTPGDSVRANEVEPREAVGVDPEKDSEGGGTFKGFG